MPIPSHMKLLYLAGFVLLPLAVLPGCATPEAVSEQTEPLKTRIDKLTQALSDAGALARANQEQAMAAKLREEDLTRRLAALGDEVKSLRVGLGERATQAELRLDELATQTRDLSERMESSLDDQHTTSTRVDGIEDRLAQFDRGLDQVAETAEESLALGTDLRKMLDETGRETVRLGERIDRMAETQADMSRKTETLAAGMAGNAAAQAESATKLADVGERQTQGELRLDELATRTHDLESRANDLAARLDAGQESQRVADAKIGDLTAGLAQVRLQSDQAGQKAGEALALGVESREKLAGMSGETAHLGERVGQVESTMSGLEKIARQAMELAIQEEIRAKGKVAFDTVLTADKTLYPLNLAILSVEDRAALDTMVAKLQKLDKNYHLEIQGHTDNIGVDDYNYQLGLARAEVVKRYLHEQGGISLSRMSVISFGATQPADGQSRGNRRIVIRVLVLDKKG